MSILATYAKINDKTNMKKIFLHFIASLAVVMTMVGCKAFTTISSSGETSTGTPYEMILVCAQPQWQSELGDTLQAIFKQPVQELMQYEPMFDVVRILPNNFGSLTQKHRNIVTVLVDPTITEPSIGAQYDITASPQIQVAIQGPDNATVAKYVSDNRENLFYVLEKAERDRKVAYVERYNSQPMHDMLKERFGADIYIPDNYKIRSMSDDMVWISQEFPTASQGFFIYKYPYEGQRSLTAEALVKARNRFAQRIPGPADGSYMTTVEAIVDDTGENYVPFMPKYRSFSIEDCPWIELSGFWEVEGDFMGGPFVSYTTVNKATKEVVTYDCYLYSPRDEKRNMLRELQHFIYLMKFPKAE